MKRIPGLLCTILTGSLILSTASGTYAQEASARTDTAVSSSREAETSAEEKFSAIYENTTADLTPYLGSEWTFTYDPFEQTGLIDPGIVLGSLSDGDSDMDSMDITVSLKIMVSVDYLTDMYVLEPVLEMKYTGAYRPYIDGAQLNIGNNTGYLTDVTTTSDLVGIQVEETAYAVLDDTVIDMIRSSEDSKAVLRVLCENRNYDITLDLSKIWCLDDLPESTVNTYSETEGTEDSTQKEWYE